MFYGFDYGPSTGGWTQFYHGHGGPGTFEGGVILIPCSKTLTSEETAQLILENLYKQFGLPDKIISYRGPQFASKAFIELLKLLGIKSALSTAYHPQTDGTTEQVNQKSKHTSQYTVPLIQKIGHKLYIPWNLLTTIEGMQIDRTPL